jgi:ABC-2 type transport system ATP-binding protein
MKATDPEARAAPAIEAVDLVKHFGAIRAVDGVTLRVPRGIVYGVLGPNGAGKTTTIRLLATLLRPDAGSARVFGHDIVREADAVRARVSLTGQYASVDEDLTGRENLVQFALSQPSLDEVFMALTGHPATETDGEEAHP